MAIITAGIPKDVLFKIFSGVTSGLAAAALDRSSRTCTPRCGCSPRCRSSAPGVPPCAAPRPRRTHDAWRKHPHRVAACGSASSPSGRGPRRGRSATTRRSGCCRRPTTAAGRHRVYTEDDVERLREHPAAARPARALAGGPPRPGRGRGRPRGPAPRVRTTPTTRRGRLRDPGGSARPHRDQLELVAGARRRSGSWSPSCATARRWRAAAGPSSRPSGLSRKVGCSRWMPNRVCRRPASTVISGIRQAMPGAGRRDNGAAGCRRTSDLRPLSC